MSEAYSDRKERTEVIVKSEDKEGRDSRIREKRETRRKDIRQKKTQ